MSRDSNKRWRKRNIKHFRELQKKNYQKNKKERNTKIMERNEEIDRGARKWYDEKVTGFLDYHYGLEKFEIARTNI